MRYGVCLFCSVQSGNKFFNAINIKEVNKQDDFVGHRMEVVCWLMMEAKRVTKIIRTYLTLVLNSVFIVDTMEFKSIHWIAVVAK